ncbi:Scr1 family TA system antitoxin-like transcriptional regulator [Plantactinospora sp. KLBMP9567]|uniref:Scr1 family TA system antitoxin-like transcriptional regulator n=1 Tax=Plantactinospora sp. KLBMP9567 TaxID=3085900 RepID=UPI002980A3E8|nr:Scr1 family TA system antitoxin-like transcriptional regulator [Plantactinospora sp. KLBMP9567]MDW5325093.1 Scr1 family TA system antitoxin-like transcriptional regulator [Plantactinospora sp. KLBMP9567]MDW5329294.1 Scr1 family TA system antitoxin-like transcriptional regulator [Plantactinospora sp. KLBMP9567]
MSRSVLLSGSRVRPLPSPCRARPIQLGTRPACRDRAAGGAASRAFRPQLQVVPTRVGMYPGYGGPFTLADLPDNRRVGHADNQLAARIVDGADEIATLVGRWEQIRGYALPVDQSLELIKKVATSWS